MKVLAMLLFAGLTVAGFVGCDNQMSTPTSPSTLQDAPEGQAFAPGVDRLQQVQVSYRITVENLTPATQPGASQPLSPIIVATHTPRFHVYKIGRYASVELRQEAEDAVDAPLVSWLNSQTLVLDVAKGDGVILPGQSASVTIQAAPGFHRLSLVSMLVNTNDAFAGLDGVRLPRTGKKVVYAYAYDAGTEKNTESVDHIPGPCCGHPFVRVPTHERIRMHEGITGRGDLDPTIYNWDGPVARITIERL